MLRQPLEVYLGHMDTLDVGKVLDPSPELDQIQPCLGSFLGFRV